MVPASHRRQNTDSENEQLVRDGREPMVRVSDEGVSLRSYRDGKMLFFSPESTVDAQKARSRP